MKARNNVIAAVLLIALGAAAYVFGVVQYQWMVGGVEVNLFPAAGLLLAGAVLLWRAWLSDARS